jgi:UDP-N-acetylmuramoyl-tripeptide--D-alanyl-D-alanine ligase
MADPLWRLGEAAAAMGARLGGCDPHDFIGGVSIDSRSLAAGDLFFAIKGERADGHDYVAQALANGAAAAVVSRPPAEQGRYLHVADTLEALNQLGVAARARADARIIGVTGSVGKTGTKEMLRLMFGAQASTHASVKSYNNLWGVPLSLARMPAATRFGVFEMGMNHAGEITPLTRMVRPHIAIITTVGPVHIEFFDSVAAIADAKAEIFAGLEPGGIAVLPADNEHFDRLADHAERRGAVVVPFGAGVGCQARLVSYAEADEGAAIDADILGERVAFRLAAPGRHLAMNAVAAVAAVRLAGADVGEAASALGAFHAPDGRGRRMALSCPDGGEVLLIDESYNANPSSMRAALDVLAGIKIAQNSRKVAVLGDMLELGHGSLQYHAELADVIDFAAVDLVFCAGPHMKALFDRVPPASRGGHANSAEELAAQVCDAVRAGDVVMVKGSLGSRMARVVEALKTKLNTRQANDGLGRSAA